MSNLNKVMLMGNLTRDPELRYTPKGTAVGEIGLAVNRKVKDGDGWKDETTFVDVTIWGKVAENVSQFLKKGRGVFVEGRLQLDTWEDKDSGQKRTKLKVIGESVQFLPSRQQAESSARAKAKPSDRPAESAPDDGYDDEGEDIPF